MTSPKEVCLVLRREIVNLFVVEKGAEQQEEESVNKMVRSVNMGMKYK